MKNKLLLIILMFQFLLDVSTVLTAPAKQVIGPTTPTTDKAIAIWDGTTGFKLLNTSVTITDGTNVTISGTLIVVGTAEYDVMNIGYLNPTNLAPDIIRSTNVVDGSLELVDLSASAIASLTQGSGGTNSGPITLYLGDGTNVAVSCTTPLGCVTNAPLFFSVTLTNNCLVQNPTGMGDGQVIELELIQDATGNRLGYLDTAFAFGTTVPGPLTLSTNAAGRDFATFRYRAATGKWYCRGFVRGY